MKNIKLYNKFTTKVNEGLANKDEILNIFQEVTDLGHQVNINIFENGGRPGHEEIYIEIITDFKDKYETINDGVSLAHDHIELLNTILSVNNRLSEKYNFMFDICGEEMCIYTVTYISKNPVL